MGRSKRETRSPGTKLPQALYEQVSGGDSSLSGSLQGLHTIRKAARKEVRKEKRRRKKAAKEDSRRRWMTRRRKRRLGDKDKEEGEGEEDGRPEKEPVKDAMRLKRRKRFEKDDALSGKRGMKISDVQDDKPHVYKGSCKSAIGNSKESDSAELVRLERLLGIARRSESDIGEDNEARKLYEKRITLGDPELMALLDIANGCSKANYDDDSDIAPDEEIEVEMYEEGRTDDKEKKDGGKSGSIREAVPGGDIGDNLSSSQDYSEEQTVKKEGRTRSDDNTSGGESSFEEASESDSAGDQETVFKNAETSRTSSDGPYDHRRTNAAAKHAPPSRRQVGAENIVAHRRFRSLLNRLTDSNSGRIAQDLVAIFQSPPAGCNRQLLAEVYASAVLDSVRDGTGAANINPYIATHAVIISHIASVVGVSVSACVVVMLVRRVKVELEKLARDPACRHAYGYVALLNEMYIRKTIHCSIIYELIRILAERFLEPDIELLLLIIRGVGIHIRADDPLALKDIIMLIQEKAHSLKGGKRTQEEAVGECTTRVQVMLDLIYDVKNNKLKSAKNDSLIKYDWALTSPTALKASFDELLDPEFTERHWWEDVNFRETQGGTTSRKSDTGKMGVSSTDLTSLAISQRLNTDYRRTLFTAIMSSADVTDAFSRLISLGALNTKKGHERDAARIILHCCCAENVYNPFYGRLAREFCRKSTALAYSFQYALWDVFKAVDGSENTKPMSTRRIINCASLLGYLLGCQALRLAVLKGGDIDTSRGARKSLLFRRALEICLKAKHGMKSFDVLCAEKWNGAMGFRSTLAVFIRKELTAADIKDTAQKAVDMLEGANVLL